MQVSNSIPQVHRVAACGWTKIFAAFLVCAVLALPASAQTFVILHSFIGGTEGYAPDGPLVQGFDGKFYGVTGNGGTGSNSGCGTAGCGTVYGVGRYGKLTTLYSFCSQRNCPDGYGPYSRLAEGPYGTLYGVTSAGGVNSVGTAFKITQADHSRHFTASVPKPTATTAPTRGRWSRVGMEISTGQRRSLASGQLVEQFSSCQPGGSLVRLTASSV